MKRSNSSRAHARSALARPGRRGAGSSAPSRPEIVPDRVLQRGTMPAGIIVRTSACGFRSAVRLIQVAANGLLEGEESTAREPAVDRLRKAAIRSGSRVRPAKRRSATPDNRGGPRLLPESGESRVPAESRPCRESGEDSRTRRADSGRRSAARVVAFGQFDASRAVLRKADSSCRNSNVSVLRREGLAHHPPTSRPAASGSFRQPRLQPPHGRPRSFAAGRDGSHPDAPVVVIPPARAPKAT